MIFLSSLKLQQIKLLALQRHSGRCSQHILLDTLNVYSCGCIHEKARFRGAFSWDSQFTGAWSSNNKAHKILSMGSVYTIFSGKFNIYGI